MASFVYNEAKRAFLAGELEDEDEGWVIVAIVGMLLKDYPTKHFLEQLHKDIEDGRESISTNRNFELVPVAKETSLRAIDIAIGMAPATMN